jgi:hypothetical protein
MRLLRAVPRRPGFEVVERRGRRRRHWPSVASLLALAAVCGATVACGSSAGGAAGGAAGAGIPAAIRQQIESAQDPAGYLVKTTQEGPGGAGSSSVSTVWTDPATGNAMLQRGSGSAKVANWERDYYQDRVLHWAQTQVNYGPRTWWTADDHDSAPVKGPVPSGPVGGGEAPEGLVKLLLGQSGGKIAGHPVADGHDTIELSVSAYGAQYYIWADSRTYQVVRLAKYFSGALSHLQPVVSEYSWVRTSAAMVNLINHPQVPAGFAQVKVGQYDRTQ